MPRELPTILDSCVLINLAASDEIADIVNTIGDTTFICTAARNEALFLRDEIDTNVRLPLNLDDVLAIAHLQVCDLASEQE
jgi:hypothetical protein